MATSLVKTLVKGTGEGDEIGEMFSVPETDTLVIVRTESNEEMPTEVDGDERGEMFPDVEKELVDDVLVFFDGDNLLEAETESVDESVETLSEEMLLVFCPIARKTVIFFVKECLKLMDFAACGK